MAITKKDRKQTYPFKTIGLKETFTIKANKYNSMCTALRQHNKDHSPITLEASTVGNNIVLTRTA